MFAFRMLMAFFCLSTLLISCGDGGGAGTNGDVGSISEFRVSSSRVHVGQEVTLSARAKSLDDKGVPDVEISFSVEINQSGSTSGTMKATTDGSGYASVTWKAGFQTGTDTIVARGPGDAKATLQVNVLAVSVSEFTASQNPVFPAESTQITARILDADGFGVGNLNLYFALAQNQSQSQFTPQTLTTDDAGYAFLIYTVGERQGMDVLRLTTPDGANSDIVLQVVSPRLAFFSASPNPAAPSATTTLQVQVVDESDTGIGKKNIIFAVADNQSGATTLSHSATTDEAGWARTLHEVGPYEGTDQLYVVAPGGATSVMLPLVVTSQIARIGDISLAIEEEFPDLASLSATVRDELGDVVKNVTVNFSTTFGKIVPSYAVTDANGKAKTSVSSLTSGRAKVTATCGDRNDFVYVSFGNETNTFQNLNIFFDNNLYLPSEKNYLTARLDLVADASYLFFNEKMSLTAIIFNPDDQIQIGETVIFTLNDSTGGYLTSYAEILGPNGARTQYISGSVPGQAFIKAECGTLSEALNINIGSAQK